MMDWLDVLAAREILSGVPVFYYPCYLGILIDLAWAIPHPEDGDR